MMVGKNKKFSRGYSNKCALAYIKNIMISSNPLGLFFRVVSDNYKPKSVEIFQF